MQKVQSSKGTKEQGVKSLSHSCLPPLSSPLDPSYLLPEESCAYLWAVF